MAIFLQSSEHSPVVYLDVTADVQRLIVVFLDEAHQLNVAAVSGGCKSGVGGEGGNASPVTVYGWLISTPNDWVISTPNFCPGFHFSHQ